MINQIPPLSADLIELLNQKYPEQSPNPKDDERVIWMKAGKRQLVRELLESMKRINGQP